MKSFLQIIFIVVLFASCGNSNKEGSNSSGSTKIESIPSDIDTTMECGLIIKDTLTQKKLVQQFFNAPSLERSPEEGAMVLSVLGQFDLNGFVKKISNDTIFCVAGNIKKGKNKKSERECIIQQVHFGKLYPKTNKTVVILYYAEKLTSMDSLRSWFPHRIVLLGKY